MLHLPHLHLASAPPVGPAIAPALESLTAPLPAIAVLLEAQLPLAALSKLVVLASEPAAGEGRVAIKRQCGLVRGLAGRPRLRNLVWYMHSSEAGSTNLRREFERLELQRPDMFLVVYCPFDDD